MRLTGLHAQGDLTLQDALAKMGAGKLTPAEFTKLEALMREQQLGLTQGSAAQQVATLPPILSETKP
jgi:hypothetical protein